MAFPINRRTIVRGVAAVPFALLSARYQIKRALAADDVTPADITQLTVLAAGLDSREADQPENADVFIIARIDVPNATVALHVGLPPAEPNVADQNVPDDHLVDHLSTTPNFEFQTIWPSGGKPTEAKTENFLSYATRLFPREARCLPKQFPRLWRFSRYPCIA